MQANSYSVRVIGGLEVAGGYVEMSHGQTYSLQLRNSRNTRCDASVYLDSKHVGTWRIPSHTSINIERPAHDKGKFTFYKAGTSEARQAQLNESSDDLGLVRVVFTPEYEVRPLNNTWYPSSVTYTSGWKTDGWNPYVTYRTSSVNADYPVAMAAMASPAKDVSAGGTGLSGKSGQDFGTAEQMSLDYGQRVTINLRLVCKDDSTPRPLTAYETPVPPPVH